MRSALSANTLCPAPNVQPSWPGLLDSFLGQPGTMSYAPKMSCPPFSVGTAATRVGADWAASVTALAMATMTIGLRIRPPQSKKFKAKSWKVSRKCDALRLRHDDDTLRSRHRRCSDRKGAAIRFDRTNPMLRTRRAGILQTFAGYR